jgi:dihydroceramidase
MTGTGAYYYIVWGIWLRHYLNYKQNEYEIVWPNYYTVPEVVRRGSVAKETSKSGEKEL